MTALSYRCHYFFILSLENSFQGGHDSSQAYFSLKALNFIFLQPYISVSLESLRVMLFTTWHSALFMRASCRKSL